MCSYNCRSLRYAAALQTACDTAEAHSHPATSRSAGSSGITTTAAAALPFPLYHTHIY